MGETTIRSGDANTGAALSAAGAPVKRNIDSLTGIRAIAASWVVIFHIYEVVGVAAPNVGVLTPLVHAGNLGVDFFFMLSGFVISYNYLDRLGTKDSGQIGHFLWLRVARIYPVHLFTLLVFAALVVVAGILGLSLGSQGQYTPLNFVMNGLMLQAIPPAFAWNNPAWSISAEFAAYLMFPLIARGLMRLKSRAVTIGLLLGILIVGIVALSLVVSHAEQWAFWSGYVLIWIRIAIGFTVGCLLFVLWRSFGELRFSPRLNIAIAVGVVGVVAACYVAPQDTILVFPALALPFLALIILGAASGTGPLNRLLGSPLLEWGGRVSYSVYMTHFVVLTVASKAVGIAGFTAPSLPVQLALLAGLIVFVVAIGAGTYYLVEEPARRLMRTFRSPFATRRDTARTH